MSSPHLRESRKTALLMLSPALMVLALLALYPICRVLLLSFSDMNLTTGFASKFAGLKNFYRVFNDSLFWQSLTNTVIFTLISVSLELILGMASALLLHKNFKGRGMVRALAILPWALPTAVMALAWSWIFNDSFGVLNDLLLRMGIIKNGIAWLGTPWGAMISLIVADVWKTTPFMMIIILAGLQSIPGDLYEAIRLDGANSWQEFRLITLPLLRPTLIIALLFRAIAAFGIFDLVFILTGGGPGGATETVSLYAYKNYYRYLDFGYGAALILVSFLLLFAVVLWITKPTGSEE